MEEAEEEDDLDERMKFKSHPDQQDITKPKGYRSERDKARMDDYRDQEAERELDDARARKKMQEEEELEEAGAAQRKGDPRVRRQDPDRLREEEELEEKLGDGKTQGTDSKDAGLDDNPEFTGKDFAAEKGGERGKKGKKPTKEQIEALVKKALQEALQKRKG